VTALRAVLEAHGLPMALYTDRASWAGYTPMSGTSSDRSKRVNCTLQDRLVNASGVVHS
jgi:hypothetical protein